MSQQLRSADALFAALATIFGSLLQRLRSVDALFAALATIFGSLSLFYPFGRDQGLFYYAAREWLLRGQVLYRDVWDHKPPVIYFIHMAVIAVTGENAWGIRLLELVVAVPLVAWLTARLASPRGTPVATGVFGAAWLGVALVYYGYFNFWDTAQPEIWSAVFVTAGLVSALRSRRAALGALGAGVLCALALFTKPPVVFFVVICGAAVLLRARTQSGEPGVSVVRCLAAWAIGGVCVGVAILGYFAARHALRPMLDILVGANAAYLDQEKAVHSFADVLGRTGFEVAMMQPFSTIFILIVGAATFVGFARNDRALFRRYLLPALLLAASFSAVLLQLKFYHYHWGTIVAASGLFAANLYGDMVSVARPRGARWLAPTAFLAFLIGFYAISGSAIDVWLTTARRTVGYALGKLSREEFSRTFDLGWMYSNHDAELTGLWLRAHAEPGDTLVVRGFEPEIYATSGLHFTGRFFWTPFLTHSTRVYRRDEWLAEDEAAIRRRPPRFAVALRRASEGIDSPAWFERLGYRRRRHVGLLTILERDPHIAK